MKNENLRKEAVAASIVLINAHNGFKNVTLSRIARSVGVQASTLYNYFDSKKDILSAVVEHICNHFHKQMNVPTLVEVDELLTAYSPREVFRHYSFFPSEHLEYNLSLLRIMYGELFSSPEIPRRLYEFAVKHHRRMRALLRHLVELGAIPPCETSTLAEIWTRTTFTFTVWYVHQENAYRTQYENTIQVLTEIAVGGVFPVTCDVKKLKEAIPVIIELPTTTTTREKICWAAFDLFCNQGFEKTSLSQIAAAVGITYPAIYRHYENKGAILRDLLMGIKRAHQCYFKPYMGAFDNRLELEEVGGPQDISAYLINLANNYLYTNTRINKSSYRLMFNEQFNNLEVKYYFTGSVDEDRDRLATYLKKTFPDAQLCSCDYYTLATIYLFTLYSINAENAFFDRSDEDTRDYRIRSISLIAGILLHGLPKNELGSGAAAVPV